MDWFRYLPVVQLWTRGHKHGACCCLLAFYTMMLGQGNRTSITRLGVTSCLVSLVFGYCSLAALWPHGHAVPQDDSTCMYRYSVHTCMYRRQMNIHVSLECSIFVRLLFLQKSLILNSIQIGLHSVRIFRLDTYSYAHVGLCELIWTYFIQFSGVPKVMCEISFVITL